MFEKMDVDKVHASCEKCCGQSARAERIRGPSCGSPSVPSWFDVLLVCHHVIGLGQQGGHEARGGLEDAIPVEEEGERGRVRSRTASEGGRVIGRRGAAG